MIKRVAVSLVVACLIVLPVYAGKVTVDYDRNYTSKVENFQWRDSAEAPTNGLMYQRIVTAIKQELTVRGIEEVQADPDIHITVHGSVETQTNFNTTSMGYGYPSGWYRPYGYYGAGMSTSTTTTSTWEIGTLVIDAIDVETSKLLWRGTAEQTLSSNPQKNERKINSAIRKIFKKWDKIKKKTAKKKK